jgi:NADP-dependent 3-hydroxy acid dehydrogenase YdfG
MNETAKRRTIETDFASILNVNIAGFFHISQLAVAEMEKQGSGHVTTPFAKDRKKASSETVVKPS